MAMTLRLDDETQRALDELAEATHQSRSAVVRMAILETAARHEHVSRVQAAFDEGESRYAQLLDRLRRA
ncbi:ribbon-helix-helix protein, CopG family [Angustibacter sp. McL0619]|uniref:ribbon-helix-helix protein, CopG family n=1 Tax=Angustibacter sp. McL0619 TaxID=3415676 RepID=UPI003CEF4913